MAILNFLVHLLSGVILLLFAVRFMRVGIERLWSARIRDSLGETSATLPLLAKGAGLGFLMQGATVVMLMATGLVGSQTIPFASAVLLAMGADFGSALAVQVLTLPISAIGPLAMVIGGLLYLYSPAIRRKNLGRVILGLGLILLSLGVIRAAVEPLQAMQGASSLLIAVQNDPVTCAIIGLCLTLLMHSSLAAILTGLVFASHGSLAPLPGLCFVLGCNIGSALLPLWLLRAETGLGQGVARIVALLRTALAVLLLFIATLAGGRIGLPLDYDTGTVMLAGHLGFNFVLLFLAPLARVMAARHFRSQAASAPQNPITIPAFATDPDLMVAATKAHLGRMLDTLSEMFEEVMSSAPDATRVADCERRLNMGLSDLRRAYAQMTNLPAEQARQIRDAMDFAIRIERCGDIFSDRYMTIRIEGIQGAYRLSPEGQQEISTLAQELRKGLVLARSVVWTGDAAEARRLVEHKQHVSALEEDSRRQHLQRVSTGNLVSLGSSDQHLETIAALKEVNSKLATIAYSVLDQYGELEQTRLKAR